MFNPFKKKDKDGNSKKDGNGGNSKKNGDGDKKGGGFSNFFKKFILRKKESDTKSAAERPMTSEEKNKLAAEVASDTLVGLDKKAREQVAKALAAEMQRRHEERERRRKQLMMSTQVHLPWGPKPQKHVPRTSAGASVYPIKLELTPEAKASSQNLVPEAEPWDDSAWRPVAAGPAGPTLEESRRAWLKKQPKAPAASLKSTKKSPSMMKSTSKKVVAAAPPSPPPTQVYGSQPQAIQMDEEALKEIHAHTLGKMLQNILLEAGQTQKKAPPKPTKQPIDMTPDELIELRKLDPRAWDAFTRNNTITAFGVSTATDEDKELGKKTMAKQRTQKVQFDDETDVAKAPVGRDFHFNETLNRSTGSLKK